MEEIWKDIVIGDNDYTGYYQVSNLGRVRSLDRIDCAGRFLRGAIMSNIKHNRGYEVVTLCKDGGRRKYLIHVLVATAFVSNPNNLPQVGHKDETRDNNCADNLEWTTQKENNSMPLRLKRLSEGMKGKKHTQEWKEIMSKRNSGENNPFYGHEGLRGGKNPKAKKVICDGVVYETILECAQAYGLIKGGHLGEYLKYPKKMSDKWKKRNLAYYKESEE